MERWKRDVSGFRWQQGWDVGRWGPGGGIDVSDWNMDSLYRLEVGGSEVVRLPLGWRLPARWHASDVMRGWARICSLG